VNSLYTAAPPLVLDLTAACPLGSGCDDVGFNLNYPPGLFYTYMGQQYSQIGVTTNGYLVAGGIQAAGDVTASNQVFPNPGIPNNVIAPLWTDLDLDDPNDMADTGGGQLLVWGTATHTVFEWLDAQQFGAPGTAYSFQVWIEDNTDNITFAYDTLPALGGNNVTVGAENSTGTVGVNYYTAVDGTVAGTAPAEGDDLQVLQTIDTFTGTFQVNLVTPANISTVNLVNTVEVLNTENANKDLATATTVVQAFTLRLPIIFR